MAFEAIRGYLQLASGVAEVTRAKAMEAASSLLALSSSVGGSNLAAQATQAQELAEELLAAARANRRNLLALIRSEVESAVGRASMMSVDELDRARAGMAKLSADVEELRDQVLAMPAVRAIPGVSEVSSMLGVSPDRPGPVLVGPGSVGGSVSSAPVPFAETGTGAVPVPPATKTAVKKAAPVKKAAAKKAAPATTRTTPTTTAATKKAATTRATKKAATTRATKKAATTRATKKAATTTAATTKAATTKAATTQATKKAATTRATKKAATTRATKKAATTKAATKKAATKSAASGGSQ